MGPQPKRVVKEIVFDQFWRLSAPANAVQSPAVATMPMSGPPVAHPIAPPVAPMGVAMPPAAVVQVNWYLTMNGQNYGPYPAPTLQAMIPTGQFTVSSMVWREGMAAWAAAASVPELAPLFTPISVGVVPPAPLPVTGFPPSN